jgi:hypothetical protein
MRIVVYICAYMLYVIVVIRFCVNLLLLIVQRELELLQTYPNKIFHFQVQTTFLDQKY